MGSENYTDGYKKNDLPLFRKGRDNQIEDMANFVNDIKVSGSHKVNFNKPNHAQAVVDAGNEL